MNNDANFAGAHLTKEDFCSDIADVERRALSFLIIDPHQKAAESIERLFTDRIALAFHEAGSRVVWHVSYSDKITERPHATILRDLAEPELSLEFSVDSENGDYPNSGNGFAQPKAANYEHTRDLLSPKRTIFKNAIIRIDEWAQAEIRAKRSKPLRYFAKRCYRLIRLYYRIEYATNSGLHLLSTKLRKTKRLYWTYVYPIQWRARKLVSLAYWHTLRPVAKALGKNVFPPTSCTRWVVKKLRKIKNVFIGSGTTRAQAWTKWSNLLSNCSEGSSILLPTASIDDVYELFHIVPALRLDKPLACTIHVVLLDITQNSISPDNLRFLVNQLKTGSPFRAIVFHAWSETVQSVAKEVGLYVQDLKPHASNDKRDLKVLFGPAQLNEVCSTNHITPSITLSEFGPIALQMSALWGKVGSNAVFDAQLKYLTGRGFFVARVFVDHYPQNGDHEVARAKQLTVESFEQSRRPHIHFIMTRRDSAPIRDKQFQSATPVLRSAMLLASASAMDEQESLKWIGERTSVAIVNHLPHVLLAQQITSAPIILETHDIYSHLLSVHGIPHFVPSGPDSEEKRLVEERKLWASVAACVNLSPEDHEQVEPYARHAALIKPYVERRKIERRSWLQVFTANGLSEKFKNHNEFDILLWGSWHQGNVDSITWFVKEVMPLDHRLDNASVAIVGRVAAGLPSEISQHPQVFVTGFVDDLDDFVVRSKVLVIPDKEGTGISIKAMDAFARGACFASSKAGLRGILLEGIGYLPCTTAKALASDVAELLGSPEKRLHRSVAAEALYDANFSQQTYESHWNSLLAKIIPAVIPSEIQDNVSHSPESRAEIISDVKKASNSVKFERSGSTLKAKSKPALTVVVCTYDRYDVLPDAINSLLNQDVQPGTLEIIIVDNSPDQKAAANFGKRYSKERLQYILEPVPGLSNARNVGAERAKASAVAYIDDDAIARPDWARGILAVFQTNGLNCTGVVGGRVMPRWVTPPPKWLNPKLYRYLSILDWGNELRPIRPGEWLVGCNIAYNKTALVEAGGFSRALGRVGAGIALLSNEDIEIAEKLTERGLLSYYVPEAIVEHVIDPNRLTQNWFRRHAAWQAVSDFIKDPKTAQRHLAGAEKHLLWAVQSGTRSLPVGIFSSNASAQEFSDDVNLIYNLTIATLSGGCEAKHEK